MALEPARASPAPKSGPCKHLGPTPPRGRHSYSSTPIEDRVPGCLDNCALMRRDPTKMSDTGCPHITCTMLTKPRGKWVDKIAQSNGGAVR
jgi:hypothetical protein